MDDRQIGNMLTNVAVALFAGALGSVLTLAATQRFAVVERPLATQEPAVSIATMADADSAGLKTKARADDSTDTVDADNAASILAASTAEIRKALEAAAEERSQLSAALLMLTRQIDELEANVVNLNSLSAMNTGQVDSRQSSEALPANGANGDFTPFGADTGLEQQFDNLVAAGVDEQSARELQLRGDQYQLARLELFDQAAREGWVDSDEFSERLEALDESRVDLREELGDAAFDRYLYESGRPNRVGIASIINGSAAEQSGLQTGDLVISYAGERIFRVQELQDATRAGSRGEYVQLVYDRGGQALTADIPRGPLGVTLSTSRLQP